MSEEIEIVEAGEIVETTDGVDANVEQQALEDRARRMGWKPQDEYRGPPGRWRDAKTFIDHGENELPVLRERLRETDKRWSEDRTKLTAELTDTKTKVTELTETITQMMANQKIIENNAYTRAKTDIETKMVAAVAVADLPTYHNARQELDRLDETYKPIRESVPRSVTPPPPAPPANNTIDPEIEIWTRDNPWFSRDNALKAYAIDEDQALMARYPGMTTADRLDEVRKRTVAKFPEKFGNPRRSAAAAVSGSSPPPPKKDGKSVNDLPADAKAACAKFVRDGLGKEEDYLKVYFAGE